MLMGLPWTPHTSTMETILGELDTTDCFYSITNTTDPLPQIFESKLWIYALKSHS